jgi:hypothetical protein
MTITGDKRFDAIEPALLQFPETQEQAQFLDVTAQELRHVKHQHSHAYTD